MLTDEQVKELRRLDGLVEPKVFGFETTHAHVGPRGGRVCVGLMTSAFPLNDGEFAYMTVDMAKLLSMARTHLPALLSAHADAVRLREKMDRVRMFLQWMADYEKSPPEIVKDDFAYDRLMSWMKRSCGEWASKCEAALRHAEQGGA